MKVDLGIRLRQSGQFCKANELFYDVYKQEKKVLNSKQLKFTLDQTIKDMKNAGHLFSEEVIRKVFAQICHQLADAKMAKLTHGRISPTNIILFEEGWVKFLDISGEEEDKSSSKVNRAAEERIDEDDLALDM